ncbi:MAG: hypothetical protein GPJ54_03290 [Candidatus Heimdallarchaeota archaeon]|nr:hypothetical protein [Candidatus Heimdallarchaeota archaeon]
MSDPLYVVANIFLNTFNPNFDSREVADLDNREIWERLIKTALEDSVLSSDEHSFLKNVLSDLETYENTLSHALEDGIIDVKEKANLFIMRTQLIKKMYDIANIDDKITDEEIELIRATQKIINSLADIEHHSPQDF